MPAGPHQKLKVTFLSQNRKARCKANPDYPDGIVLDVGDRPACAVEIPYPAECVGAWIVRCEACGASIAATAAGRRDDPRVIVVPCRLGLNMNPKTEHDNVH